LTLYTAYSISCNAQQINRNNSPEDNNQRYKTQEYHETKTTTNAQIMRGTNDPHQFIQNPLLIHHSLKRKWKPHKHIKRSIR